MFGGAAWWISKKVYERIEISRISKAQQIDESIYAQEFSQYQAHMASWQAKDEELKAQAFTHFENCLGYPPDAQESQVRDWWNDESYNAMTEEITQHLEKLRLSSCPSLKSIK